MIEIFAATGQELLETFYTCLQYLLGFGTVALIIWILRGASR